MYALVKINPLPLPWEKGRGVCALPCFIVYTSYYPLNSAVFNIFVLCDVSNRSLFHFDVREGISYSLLCCTTTIIISLQTEICNEKTTLVVSRVIDCMIVIHRCVISLLRIKFYFVCRLCE